MKTSALEQCLIWYARSFPVQRGKLRIVNALWPLGAQGRGTSRIAKLLYGGFEAPCDLRDMLQRQFYFFGTYRLEQSLLAHWSNLAREATVVFDCDVMAVYSGSVTVSRAN